MPNYTEGLNCCWRADYTVLPVCVSHWMPCRALRGLLQNWSECEAKTARYVLGVASQWNFKINWRCIVVGVYT